MKKLIASSVIALLAFSGAALAADTGGMAKDANMHKHMKSSHDGMAAHGAMKSDHSMMKSGHAMKGDHAMKSGHKMKSDDQ